MNIQELRKKFEDLGHIEVFKDTKWEESAKIDIEENVKLSIQFAIEVLENITNKSPNDVITNILNEIEELKQQL